MLLSSQRGQIIVSTILTVMLVAPAMTGCEPLPEYSLTMSSTAGGSVTAPGEGTFTYAAGTVVNLVAEADEGYEFAGWLVNVSSDADVNAPSTTITITGHHTSHYTITASFSTPEIRDWHDLNLMRYNLGGHYALMNDLDSAAGGYEELAGPTANNGRGWEQIGFIVAWVGEPPPPEFHRFHGTFDGQGHEIRDLFIHRPADSGAGLFRAVTGAAVIKNLGLVAANVTGGQSSGGLVGDNWGTVSDCYFSGGVSGSENVGGLVGHNRGTVSNSYSGGSVSGTRSVGGLVGYNAGVVSNAYYNYDEVLLNGQKIITIGALFGEGFDEWLGNEMFLDVNERLSLEDGYHLIGDVGDFRELLAFGQDESLKFRLKSDLDLSNDHHFFIPYLAGEFDGNGHTISNWSFDFDSVAPVGLFGHLASGGKVSRVGVEGINIRGDHRMGGLVGRCEGTVSNSYSTGSVTGVHRVGGLVGYSLLGTIDNSYSTCSVSGGGYIGGLVGHSFLGTIDNSYSTGNVTGEHLVGGLVGSTGGFVGSSFWDVETSGTETDYGRGTGKTTAEMMDIATYTDTDTETEGLDEAWDMAAVANADQRNPAYIWNIVDGQTYPFLSWQSVWRNLCGACAFCR